VRGLKDENKRVVDKCRKLEIEFDKAKKEQNYIL